MIKEFNSGVLILYYHRINDSRKDPFNLCVSPERFEMQISYLAKNYRIVRFDDSWNYQDKQIVVTFDDGYADNLYNALPILEKYNVPATIFVATGQIMNNKVMWWDELYELVVEMNDNNSIKVSDRLFGCEWTTSNYEQKLNCYYAIHKMINHYISVETKDRWIEELRQQIGYNIDMHDYALLTAEELFCLSESKLITIGGHTLSHMSLGKMNLKEQEFEILENIRQLENITKKKINVFSYPFGVEDVDCNQDTISICKQNGITKAATTAQKLCTLGSNSLLIPRIEVKNWTEKEFIKKIEEFWTR